MPAAPPDGRGWPLAVGLLTVAAAIATFVLQASLAAACAGAGHETFSGRVVAVIDGDSIKVLRNGAAVEVRLHGIDAPEGGQAFGSVAKRALSNLIFGKTVLVEVRDIDQYKRPVVRVTADGRDVGLEMVREGFAWHYARYLDDARYAAAQKEAQAARRGLWQAPAPIAPWAFRSLRNRRGGSVLY
jgi:micrococcal nuclease